MFHVHNQGEEIGCETLEEAVQAIQNEKKKLQETKKILEERIALLLQPWPFTDKGHSFKMILQHHTQMWVKDMKNVLDIVEDSLRKDRWEIYEGVPVGETLRGQLCSLSRTARLRRYDQQGVSLK